MFKKRLSLLMVLGLAWGISPSAYAGTMNLDSFVDQSPATIDLPATQLLMATVNTSGAQGGNDATATAVSISGSIAPADVAEVCVDYGGTQVSCQTNPASLTNISLTLGGNEKGGSPFDYRVTLNPSAAGKTIQLTVVSITNTILVDNIPLPASTALRTVAGGATPAVVATLPATNVTDVGARFWGEVTTDGTPGVTTCGVDWGTTSGGPYSAGTQPVACSGTGQFFVDVGGLTPDTPYFYIAWADNGVRADAPTEETFTTSPAASLPTVSTRVVPVPTITFDSAEMGGNVTADGGATVTARGVYWQADAPGAQNGTQVPMGSGTGEYFQTVSGLPSATTIFYRAYAVNSAGEQLGNELSFLTLTGPPTVDSPTVTSITATTATLGGTMSSNGGETPSACGVEWDTDAAFSSPNSEPFGVCVEGVPFAVVDVPGLPTGTLVYFRAWATNSAGTGYTGPGSFTPTGPPVLTALPATDVLLHSATMHGRLDSDSGNNITGCGVAWGTTPGGPYPNLESVPSCTAGVPFSKSVDVLSAGTSYYYKAYATNDLSETTLSGNEEPLTTLSEPTVQASNLSFATVAGRSLRMTWTRGNGDGVIVVMRLAATGRTDPQDGNDYTGDPDFSGSPPELPVNSNNFVVYKGPGTSVLVTGLTMTTDYTVAVYEYAGAGAATDYLLAPLVQGTQQTANYAVHNYDFGITCDQCHNHGSFGSRGTELKDICLGCHIDLGQAAAKQEFDNHLAPNKNPAINDVDCGVCHELHNPSGANTTLSFNSITLQTQHNKSFLRANVDKYISTATTDDAFLHTDQPKREEGNPNGDPVQAAVTPERAVEGGDATTARGYCQVCHTLTNYHRNNAAATDPAGSGRPGLMQCHDGNQNDTCAPEVHCGDCHEHNNRFVGVNASVPCEQCHDQVQGIRNIITTQFDRLSKHIPGGSTDAVMANCLVCHNQGGHTTGAVTVWNLDDGVTSYAQPTAHASTLATGEGEVFEGHCMSCHDDGAASSLPASGGDQTQTSPFTGSGAPPVIDPAAWSTAGHNRPVATAGGSPVSCVGDGANGCHGSGHGSEQLKLLAPAAGPNQSVTDFCYACHDSNGPSSHDIQAQFNTATNYRTTSGSGALVNQRHDVSSADQAYSGGAVVCSDCHSPHADNAAAPVSDPDTGLALSTYAISNSYTDDGHNFTYDSGGNNDPSNPQAGGSVTEPDYIQFCLTCHDGTTPPGVTMPADMVNMALAWNSDQHGTGEGSTGTRFGKGTLKYPWTVGDGSTDPSNPYAALNCTTCHGAHGSGSIFNLRDSITVAGVQMTIGGLDPINSEFPKPTFDGPTYTLPVNGGSQNDHQWGAWCSFCHDMSAHAGVDETTTCTSGHMHGANNF